MSLKSTKNTKSWNNIPRRCKGCDKAIFCVEGDTIFYQCSLYGGFAKVCPYEIREERKLPKPSEIKAGE